MSVDVRPVLYVARLYEDHCELDVAGEELYEKRADFNALCMVKPVRNDEVEVSGLNGNFSHRLKAELSSKLHAMGFRIAHFERRGKWKTYRVKP